MKTHRDFTAVFINQGFRRNTSGNKRAGNKNTGTHDHTRTHGHTREHDPAHRHTGTGTHGHTRTHTDTRAHGNTCYIREHGHTDTRTRTHGHAPSQLQHACSLSAAPAWCRGHARAPPTTCPSVSAGPRQVCDRQARAVNAAHLVSALHLCRARKPNALQVLLLRQNT